MGQVAEVTCCFNKCNARQAEEGLSGRLQKGLSEVVGMYSDNKVIAFSELTLFLPLKRSPPWDKETFGRSLYQILTL